MSHKIYVVTLAGEKRYVRATSIAKARSIAMSWCVDVRMANHDEIVEVVMSNSKIICEDGLYTSSNDEQLSLIGSDNTDDH